MKKVLFIATALSFTLLSNASNVSEGKLPIDTSTVTTQGYNYTINDLPDEVLVTIFQQLKSEPKDLDALALTSKRFNRVVNDPWVMGYSFELDNLISKESKPYNYNGNHHEAEKARLQAEILSAMSYLRKTSIMHAYIEDHYEGDSELDRLVAVIKSRNSVENVTPINVFKIDIHRVNYNDGTRIDDDFFAKLTFLQPTHINCNAPQLNFILEKISNDEEIAAKYRDVIFSVSDQNNNITLPQDSSKRNQMIYMLASKLTKKLLSGKHGGFAYNLINGFISKHIPQASANINFSSSIIKAITKDPRKINEKHFKVINEFLDYFYGDIQDNKLLSYKYKTIGSLFSLSDSRIESLKNNLIKLGIKNDKSALEKAIKILSKLNDSSAEKIAGFIRNPILSDITETNKANLIEIFSKISYNKTRFILGALRALQLESNDYKFNIINAFIEGDQPGKIINITNIVNKLNGSNSLKKNCIKELVKLPLENLSEEKAQRAIDLYKKLQPNSNEIDVKYLTEILGSGVIDPNINIDNFIKNINKYSGIYKNTSITSEYGIKIDNLIFYIECERDNGYPILDIIAKFKDKDGESVTNGWRWTPIETYRAIKEKKLGIEYFSEERIERLKDLTKDSDIGVYKLPYLIKAPEGNLSDDNLKKIKNFASQLNVNNNGCTKAKAIEKLLTIPVEKLSDQYIELIKSKYDILYKSDDHIKTKNQAIISFLDWALEIEPERFNLVFSAMEKFDINLKHGARISKKLVKLSDAMLNDEEYLTRVKNAVSIIQSPDLYSLEDDKDDKDDIVYWLLSFPKELLNGNLVMSIAKKYRSYRSQSELEKLNMVFEDYMKELKLSGKIK